MALLLSPSPTHLQTSGQAILFYLFIQMSKVFDYCGTIILRDTDGCLPISPHLDHHMLWRAGRSPQHLRWIIIDLSLSCYPVLLTVTSLDVWYNSALWDMRRSLLEVFWESYSSQTKKRSMGGNASFAFFCMYHLYVTPWTLAASWGHEGSYLLRSSWMMEKRKYQGPLWCELLTSSTLYLLPL